MEVSLYHIQTDSMQLYEYNKVLKSLNHIFLIFNFIKLAISYGFQYK